MAFNVVNFLKERDNSNSVYQQMVLLGDHIIGEEQSLVFLEAFSELADEQWDKYETLNEDERNVISNIIFPLWDDKSLESTELMIYVCARLGLDSCFLKIIGKNTDGTKLEDDIKKELDIAIEELGDNIADPYSDM